MSAHTYALHGRVRLRITTPGPESRVRIVYALQPDGQAVELGRVRSLGGITFLAIPTVAGADVPTIGCTSYVEGARLLAERVAVEQRTVYVTTLNLRSKEA